MDETPDTEAAEQAPDEPAVEPEPTPEEPEPVTETPAVDEPVELLELEPDPWQAQWPTGATLRYAANATFDELELTHRTEDGVLLTRRVARGGSIDVSPELADELAETNHDLTRES